jgi:hypothetical protein
VSSKQKSKERIKRISGEGGVKGRCGRKALKNGVEGMCIIGFERLLVDTDE